MDPYSVFAQPLITCVIMGEHLNLKLRVFICSGGIVLQLTSQGR